LAPPPVCEVSHEVSVDYNSIGYVTGKVVMVTGAGGSIGSELQPSARHHGPRLLVLVDHSRATSFRSNTSSRSERHFADLAACLLDIRDKSSVRTLFESHVPHRFHAAAYKHVPMMQHNPAEAFDNNSFATVSIIENALRFGTGRLVYISTDKAVEPETVMGLSKALVGAHRRDDRPRGVRHQDDDGALRQRARLERQRRAALQAPDRRRRSSDR